MTEFNPVLVEQTLIDIVGELDDALPKGRDALTNALAAKRTFEQAEARAYMKHTGPAHEKKYAAVLATEQEAIDRDAAEVAHRYMASLSRVLEKKLDAFRSIGASVREAYREAGRGA